MALTRSCLPFTLVLRRWAFNTGGGQALCLAKLLEPDGSKLDPTVPTEIPGRGGLSWVQ